MANQTKMTREEAMLQNNANGYGGQNIPAAACGRCGGWHDGGGMRQHSKSDIPVMGRIGCICYR